MISDIEIRKLIGQICNVSVRSVYRVLNEGVNSEINESVTNEVDIDSDTEEVPHKRKFNSPKKRGPKSKRKIDIDDNTKDAIRHIIYDFHLTEHRTVTIKGLQEKVNRDLNLDLGSTSLRKVIHALGFSWRKVKDNRQILMERKTGCASEYDILGNSRNIEMKTEIFATCMKRILI